MASTSWVTINRQSLSTRKFCKVRAKQISENLPTTIELQTSIALGMPTWKTTIKQVIDEQKMLSAFHSMSAEAGVKET